MIKIGIIGCGWIVETAYLPTLSQMDDVEIYAIFDIIYQKAKKNKEKYHIPNATNNFFEFLRFPLDAIIIATPNNTHTYYVKKALMAGKHVLCEKPIAFSEEDVKSIIKTARINKKLFLPAFVNRFRRDILKFTEMVPLVGEIYQVEVAWIRKSGIPRPGTWITNKSIAGGGALIDIGTHIIDVGLMFLYEKKIKFAELNSGVIKQVSQNSAKWNNNEEEKNLPFDVETWANGKLYFANDSVLHFAVSWASEINEDITSIKVIGKEGTISINTLFGFSNETKKNEIEIIYTNQCKKRKTILLPMSNAYASGAFENLIRYFLDMISGKKGDTLKPIDSIHIVSAIEMLYKSIN